jgi:uncharacterized protein YraI
MIRKLIHPIWFAFFLAVLPILACSNFLPEPAASIPPPPTLTIPTPDAVATRALALAPTATIAGGTGDPASSLPDTRGPMLTVLVNVNVRTGPGVAYARNGFLLAGESATITGRDATTGWWQIVCPANAEGTACWVTGGSSYVSVANVTEVPVAEVPTLPTIAPTARPNETENETGASPPPENVTGDAIVPVPAETAMEAESAAVPANNPFIVYVDQGELFMLYLAEENGQLTAGQVRQLTSTGGITGVWVNPDGRQLAYLREEAPSNALYILNLTTNTLQRIAGGDTLPALPGLGTSAQTRYLDQVQWSANGERLVFNTRVLPQEPGTGPAYDLWTVRPGAAPVEQIPANTGGAIFALSAQDELLLSSATTIMRADLNGTTPQTVLSFDLVNTSSEYLYFPSAQWTAAGDRAYVAIPAATPPARNADYGLWRIPAGGGPGEQIGRLAVNPIASPLYWNTDGTRLAYVRSPGGLAGNTQLHLADSDGQNDTVYERGRNLYFLAWGIDPTTFLYRGNGYVAVGRAGTDPTSSLIPAGQEVTAGRWLNRDYFLITVRTPQGQWQLTSGNLQGQALPLITFDHPAAIIDHWSP